MQKNVYAVAVLGFDDDRSLGSSETSRLALPVFQELMIGVYREQIVGPRPAFPASMEDRITAFPSCRPRLLPQQTWPAPGH